MDEDEPPNSNEDQEKTADLSDYSEPKEKPSILIVRNEDQVNEKTADLSDFLESGESKPVDEDEPPNSNEDEEWGSKDCVDPNQVTSTYRLCPEGEKCNRCWCKSKDTGKKISFACYFPVPNNHTHPNKQTPPF